MLGGSILRTCLLQISGGGGGGYRVSLLLKVLNVEGIIWVVSFVSHELGNNYNSHTCIKEDFFRCSNIHTLDCQRMKLPSVSSLTV